MADQGARGRERGRRGLGGQQMRWLLPHDRVLRVRFGGCHPLVWC